MAWKDLYTEDLTKREILVLEVIEKYILENSGKFPEVSEISKITKLSEYYVNVTLKDLTEKNALIEIKDEKGESSFRILNGSRLLGGKEGIYKKVPGVFKGKLQTRSALIPYIKKVKDEKNIFAKENIFEYVAVPFNYMREENMFAFSIPKKGLHIARKSLNIGNIGIVDTKAEYLSEDIVAKMYYEDKIIFLDKYYMFKERTNPDKDKYVILGKVVGTFKAFTNWYLK